MRSLIAVMNEPWLWPATLHGHLQRVGDELGAHVLGHRPADDPSAVGVLHGCEVEPPLPGPQVGDVRDPQHVRSVRPELPFDEVISDTDTGHPDRRAAALDLHEPRDPGLCHQPAHTPARDADALAQAKLGLHTPGAIDAAGSLVDLGDPRGQPRVDSAPCRMAPCFSQPWKPDRLTPSTSHITETGKLALSAEMIR